MSDAAIRKKWDQIARTLESRELEIAAYALGSLQTTKEMQRSFAHKKGDPPTPPSYAYEQSLLDE